MDVIHIKLHTIETLICKIRAATLMNNPVYDYEYTYVFFHLK